MTLPIVMVGIALLLLAFIGISKLVPLVFGLAAAIGLLYGLYFVWGGLSGNNGSLFIWGTMLVLGTGAVLIYLKTGFSD